MKHILVILSFLLPIGAYGQSEQEIRLALKTCDYDIPVQQIAPANGDSLFTPMRAQALKALNRYPEALLEWNSLLKADSTDTGLLMELAECYKAMNRGEQVTRCYQKAASLFPGNKYFFQQHIRSLLASERFEEARNVSHAWLEKDTLSALGYKFLGMAYEGMAQADPEMIANSFFAYNAAYRRDSLDGQTVAHIAAIFNNNNQFADAVDVTETYRLSDTLNLDVNRQNAKAYCMLKDYKKAVNRYEALKAMGDRTFTTYYYLGISHYGDNWFYGSQENLLVAHQKNPYDINVLYYLAKSCARTSWKEEGVDFMNKALELAVPTDSLMERLYDGLLECYNYLPASDPYERIEILKKIYSYNKKHTIFYRIASIYEKRTKDEANAKYYYKKYLDMAVKNGELSVDQKGDYQVRDEYTRNALMQSYAIKYIQRIEEKEFFEKGRPKTTE